MVSLSGSRDCTWINVLLLFIMVLVTSNELHLHHCTLAQGIGFISIDCGSEQNYTSENTIDWTSDTLKWPEIKDWSFTRHVNPPTTIQADLMHLSTLRYFLTTSSSKALNQSKFCYTLPAIAGNYYLIRASFWYGPSTSPFYETRAIDQIRFHMIVDTYEGVEIVIDLPQLNPWFEEMYVRALTGSSSVSVCLSAASGSSDPPFINSLELRPLPSNMSSVEFINTTNCALRAVDRKYFNSTDSIYPTIVRFPDDTMDRLWWINQALNVHTVASDGPVQVAGLSGLPPQAVMQSNWVGSTNISYDVSKQQYTLNNGTLLGSHSYYVVLWLFESDSHCNGTGKRVFDVTINQQLFHRAVDIFKLASSLYKGIEINPNSSIPLGPYMDNIVINATQALSGSLYSPAIAAVEVLQLFHNHMNDTSPTSATDVVAIRDLISSTFPSLLDFLGDPCFPQQYQYPWLKCDDTSQSLPRVTEISLSDYGLMGTLPSSISMLDQLVTLDLSNNNLSGAIPDSLSNLTRLTYLNLANNHFSGTIPPALLQKEGLEFRYEGNSNLYCGTSKSTCGSSSTSSNDYHKRIHYIIGGSVGAILCFIMIIIIIILCTFRWRKNHTHDSYDPKVNVKKEELINATSVAQEFTYQEIQIATNNFSTVLGGGGFGLVYKGNLPNGVDVAVKVLSNTSQQGPQEFLNEVTLLSRVHHRNLVGFVGYSIEKSLVLVYEFMSNGSLHDALSRRSASQTLRWHEILQILFDAAQGLAYLHYGCNIIHRDVKSSNILLSKNLEGKVSDFGISKLTSNNGDNPTTRIVGTPGYIDPEYASKLQLTEKVDIYSFGVVLLEALCGQRPILKDPETKNDNIHIIEWVKPSYERGMIEKVVDKRFENEYNVSSVWKVAEIAMACVEFEGIKRPTMDSVCNDLGEAIRMESNYESMPMTTHEVSLIDSNLQVR